MSTDGTWLLTVEEESALLPARHACGELPADCQRPVHHDFLRLCCRLCWDSACVASRELLQLAQEAWQELRPGRVCESGLLAAAVVLLQSASLDAGGVAFLREYLGSELTWSAQNGAGNLPKLHPFPFAAEFLVLYQSFVPLSQSPSCDRTDAGEEMFRVACTSADGFVEEAAQPHCSEEPPAGRATLLPSQALLQKAGCITQADDQTLALRCRSRRFDSLLGPKQAEAFQWRCPPHQRGALNKYSEMSWRNCASGFGSWGQRIESQLKCVAVQVAETLQLRPGESVLDWGSGCGWALTWMSTLYGVHPFGIEATAQNIAWARRFSRGEYCLYAGYDLGWVPDESFDAVISYWVLYHHNTTSQCRVIQQLVRKLRPGGRAWFGGNIPSPAINISMHRFRRRDWLRCLKSTSSVGGLPLTLDFIPDAALFRGSLGQIGSLPGDYLHFPPTYSAIVRRVSA
ncbi:unnamed protein product [Effrenium voratum]|nr:unnamed protein product [Effrenium voratum]